MRPIFRILIGFALVGAWPASGTAQFERADTVFRRALLERLDLAAKGLSDPRERDPVLAEVARLWADVRHPIRARSLAENVRYPGVRGLALLIKRAVIDSPEMVREIVRRCELPCDPDSLRVSAVDGFLSQRKVELAQTFADSIRDPIERINTLYRIALNHTSTDPVRRRLILQRIYATARGVTDPDLRSFALDQATHAGVYADDLSGALQLVAEQPALKQFGLLGPISMRLGMLQDQREDSVRALIIQVAERLTDPALRKEYLNYYTWIRESAGTEDVPELERIAKRLEVDPELLEVAVWRLAVDRINAGEFQRALDVVPDLRRLNPPGDVADVLTRIVEHTSRSDRAHSKVLSKKLRRELLEEAIRALARIKDPTTRDENAFSIASVLAESEPGRVLALVSTITSRHYRDQSRLAVFRILLNRNVVRVLEVARMLENPTLQVDAYGALVRHQFHQAGARQSAEIVRSIADPLVRTQARAVLAQLRDESGNAKQALAEYRQILLGTRPSEHYTFLCKHVVSPMLSLGGGDELQSWTAHQSTARDRVLALLLLTAGMIEPHTAFRDCTSPLLP